jgi:hypothetical protein
MDPSATVSSGLPPLPPGATLAAPGAASPGAASLPPLPPGAQPVPPGAQPVPPGAQPVSAAPHPAVQAGIVSPAAPPPVNTTGPGSVTENPRGEGIYRKIGPDGKEVGIPFSLAGKLGARDGYRFADDAEMHRFVKDYASDPQVMQNMQRMAGDDPGMQLLMGFARHALRDVFGIGDVASGGQGFDPKEMKLKPQGEMHSALRDFSDEADNTFGERLGGLGEEMGEFSGVMKLLPELSGSKKLQAATKLAQMAEKHPLLKQALTQGAVAGGQTYVKTGGDTGAAAEAAIGTGLITAGFGGAGALATREVKAGMPQAARTIEGVEVPEGKTTPASPAQEAGAQAYGRAAGESIRPDLERVNQATKRPVMMNQPGGAPAIPTGAILHAGPVPEININETLNRVGDYTRARQELADSLDGATSSIDEVTDGQFKKLQMEVGAARDHYYRSGTPEADQAYRQKLGEMQGLIAKTPGIEPAMRDAISAGWRHYYVMGDVTRGLDKALMGLPGDSAISQTQRGIQGKPLLSELNRAIRTHGRSAVEQALGGAERLESLEQIGNATQTNAGRKSVNVAMREIARWFPIYAGGHAGWALTGNVGGAIAGGLAAKTATEVGPEAYTAVRNAVLSNPKVAKNLLYAAQYGANPEHYGPFIASMVRNLIEQHPKEEKNDADQTR